MSQSTQPKIAAGPEACKVGEAVLAANVPSWSRDKGAHKIEVGASTRETQTLTGDQLDDQVRESRAFEPVTLAGENDQPVDAWLRTA